ncbi:MAG TPA: hypothetical protein RMH99_12960 [Sandaracinaceae bacterium LLY-WYZ-13_1]|nr:hypothetical protein [Sandaracinaceae bacterium LLY-WYZ-13_1]
MGTPGQRWRRFATAFLRRAGRAPAAACAVGLALRLAAAALPVAPSWDGVIYERAAARLADGAGYTLRIYDPAWPWDLPTAFYPPGWPAVLALWKGLGAARGFDLVLQALLGALAIPLAAALTRRLVPRRPRAPARAAWLVALWPGGVLATAGWMTEPLFTVALLAALLPLVGSPAETRARTVGQLGLAALLFGLAAYVRPTALAIAPLALAARGASLASIGGAPDDCRPSVPGAGGTATDVDPAAGTSRRPGARHSTPGASRWRPALGAALLALFALAPLAPWMARNAAQLDGAVVSSNAGANLYVGTVDARFTRIPDDLDCPAGPRELARDRCRRERALARIADDPLGWLALGVAKLGHTFGYEASPALQLGASLERRAPPQAALLALSASCTLFWLALLGGALAHAPRLGRRCLPCWAAVASLAATHFVFLGGDRYHLPLVPILAALATAGAASASGSLPPDAAAR